MKLQTSSSALLYIQVQDENKNAEYLFKLMESNLLYWLTTIIKLGHSELFYYAQVQDENKNAEYLCLSHNPFADVIGVGLDNGHIKLFDERTLQV